MSTPANLLQVESSDHFKELLSKDLARVSLLNFWAPWAEPCKQMNKVVTELARKYPDLLSLQIEAETHSEISESFDIESVPSFIVLRGHTLLERIVGADARALADAIAKYVGPQTGTGTATAPLSQTDRLPVPAAKKAETPEELNQRLRAIMNQSRVVLFMKGSPEVPRCGFSRKISGLLHEKKIEFSYFDILTDDSVRQGLKKLNDWPTFPQLIVKANLLGD
ncbi:glutaredoxin [Multifurca ochricompacta]|uniref:Glutaredoxin n=1 Tax=Multifurca ochricompacta TaxID=376703 RepID=A0AAD4LYA8_9AGAM|nr:glutaredoxin [Multifurca ochricompacta]